MQTRKTPTADTFHVVMREANAFQNKLYLFRTYSFENMRSNVYWEPSETSKMELFTKIITSFKSLTIFIKSCILDVGLGYECAFEYKDQIKTPFFMYFGLRTPSVTFFFIFLSWLTLWKWLNAKFRCPWVCVQDE